MARLQVYDNQSPDNLTLDKCDVGEIVQLPGDPGHFYIVVWTDKDGHPKRNDSGCYGNALVDLSNGAYYQYNETTTSRIVVIPMKCRLMVDGIDDRS